jgi:hypothetical protein
MPCAPECPQHSAHLHPLQRGAVAPACPRLASRPITSVAARRPRNVCAPLLLAFAPRWPGVCRLWWFLGRSGPTPFGVPPHRPLHCAGPGRDGSGTSRLPRPGPVPEASEGPSLFRTARPTRLCPQATPPQRPWPRLRSHPAPFGVSAKTHLAPAVLKTDAGAPNGPRHAPAPADQPTDPIAQRLQGQGAACLFPQPTPFFQPQRSHAQRLQGQGAAYRRNPWKTQPNEPLTN